jgi:TetR/AcrR family transcriptional repressor of nem operon
VPYSSEHKQKTRARIVESARILFNRRGFENVSIDMVMAEADLTRGGFYNHFRSKRSYSRPPYPTSSWGAAHNGEPSPGSIPITPRLKWHLK